MINASAQLIASFALQRGDFILDAQLNVPARGVSAIFGRSGAGKTTLLRCIAGLEPTLEGTLKIGDKTYQDDAVFIPAHQRRFGYIFQEPSLFPHLSVAENLRFAARRAHSSVQPIDQNQVISLLHLDALMTQFPQQLSGGQQQRAAIGRALFSQPDLLLLDEPLSSLDLQSRDDILPFLESLHRELTVPMLYVSHSLTELQRLADHMVLMERGAVIAHGPINDILTRTDLPLSHRDDAGAILHGAVARHDHHFALTELSVPGGTLSVSALTLPEGHHIRVRILARDVSIALDDLSQSSISNRLAAHIISLADDTDPAQLILQLKLGDAVILSRITKRSAARLNLAVGLSVIAQIKSVALT